jgi:hypothetical protein
MSAPPVFLPIAVPSRSNAGNQSLKPKPLNLAKCDFGRQSTEHDQKTTVDEEQLIVCIPPQRHYRVNGKLRDLFCTFSAGSGSSGLSTCDIAGRPSAQFAQ